MLTKKSLIVGAIVATLGAGAAGVGVTHAAANPDGSKPRFVSELVAAIAEKFDLSEDDVQAVFDAQAEAHRDEMRAKHEDMIAKHNEKFDEMLSQAVEDGELTQSQVDSIASKRDELQAYVESLKDETPEARRGAMKTKIDELRAWAEDNGIDEKYVRFLPPPPKGGMGGRMGGGMMGGPRGEARTNDSEI